jgi:AcrR family transcriptional regulator
LNRAAPTTAGPDRATAIRASIRRLVARHGFHGASMSAVAAEAGVATGTAYVHYSSKDELVLAAYIESKERLGQVAVAAVNDDDPPEERFRSLWTGAYRHLSSDPDEARFLVQVDGSPYADAAHAKAMAREGDPLLMAATTPDMARRLLSLPPEVLYELGLAPAVRLAARGIELPTRQLHTVADACWRAISVPGTV